MDKYHGLMGIPYSIMQFEEYKPNDYVFKYGDDGDKFYLVIKGKVTVHIPNPKVKAWEHKYQTLCQIKDEKKIMLEMDTKKDLVELRRTEIYEEIALKNRKHIPSAQKRA